MVLRMHSSKYRVFELFLFFISISIPIFYLIAHVLDFELQFWIIITHLGDKELYMALLPIIYHGISRSLGIEILMIFSTSMWLGNTFKNSLKLPRPPKELWKINAEGFGFPSGHAQGSVTFWGFISVKYRNLVTLIFTVILVTFISFSRIILGVHYIHDVIGGIALGVAIIAISIVIRRILENKTYRVLEILALVYSIILLAIPLILNISTDINYIISGTILGAALGHLELIKISRYEGVIKLGLLGRVIGSILGLIIGGIGHLAMRHISGIYLYIGYSTLSFVMIYFVGIIVNKISRIEIQR